MRLARMKRTIHINIPFHKKQDTSYPSYQQLEEEFSSLQDLNFPESALAAEYGLVELSILPLQVFPSLLHIIIISIVITIIVIIMIIFAERGLFEQLSAHGLAFPIAAAAEGRYEGALDLLLSIEHYHYFFITIFIILSILGATHLLA